MNRRILFISLTLIFVVFVIMFRYKITPASISSQKIPNTLAPTQVTKSEKTISFANETYAYSYIRVASTSDISLIPNFEYKTDIKTLAQSNGCATAINGGFYDSSGKPLGYFFTDNRTFGQQIPSLLVNGYFWVDAAGVAGISTKLPENIFYRFALQSGPLLIVNNKILPLAINNDEHARRMVVGITSDNQLIFLSVYSGDSVYLGPLLSDLPSAVSFISSKENLGLADALNLDGGSASAFYNADTSLSELTPVGSIFCIK
jgi:uncharacterized protein YigE (DUF2233 family)